MSRKTEDTAILERLIKVISRLLQTTRGEVAPIDRNQAKNLDIFDDLGLDSIETMDLLGMIESEFDIKIAVETVVGKNKIGEFEEIIQNYLQGSRL